MIRFSALRRRARLTIPAVAASALVITALAAPSSASAAASSTSAASSATAVSHSTVEGAGFITAAHNRWAHKGQAAGGALQSHATLAACTFNTQGGVIPVVPNVTPGETISISCPSGSFTDNEQVLVAQASPLFVAVDVNDAGNEIDAATEAILNANGAGGFADTFHVPAPFAAADTSAVCPPTQIQENSSLGDCLLVVADAAGNGSIALLSYTGQPTPKAPGYWESASDGGIFSFNAPFQGSTGNTALTAPIVGMAFDPNTGGYWEVASDGGIFAFNAPFLGSMGGKPLVKPIVGMAYDPNSHGYWEVASDGGIFSFGGAPFEGSEGGTPLVKPIVGMAADPLSGGYWEVASDGGIFTFGAGTTFAGSEGGAPLVKPIVGMAVDPFTEGYWEVASDGGIFSFGTSFGGTPFEGSEGGAPLVKPIVAMAPQLVE